MPAHWDEVGTNGVIGLCGTIVQQEAIDWKNLEFSSSFLQLTTTRNAFVGYTWGDWASCSILPQSGLIGAKSGSRTLVD